MLPEIGLMIGLYVITRLISFITRQNPREEAKIVKIFSAITIIITAFVIIDLMMRGTKI